jgi:cytidylate kinase
MKEQTREDPKILAAAERQMQAWALNQEIADRAVRDRGSQETAKCAVEFITISREAGAGGSEIAEKLASRLGWEVLDRNLLERMDDRFHVSRKMLEAVDETEASWVYDVLGTWVEQSAVGHEKYVAQLGKIVADAANRGHVVFVGRGAQFLLPRQHGLAVRIVAPLKWRVEHVMQREGLDEAAARQFIRRKDTGRREFVERFFHRDVEDPHLYDLVINVERLGLDGAVEQIYAAACR